MFFIMGINSGQKKLDFDQLEVCRCCGKYGHVEVFMTYTYLMLFFIPIFKWNRRYFVRMNCCGSTAELNQDTGKAIEHGEIQGLTIDSLDFYTNNNGSKTCPRCGFVAPADFDFCPKCGSHL